MPLMATSQRDFSLGKMVDDLASLTVEMCGKKQDKCTRFPKYLYPVYVDRLMQTAFDIQSDIILANESKNKEYRNEKQRDAAAKSVYMCHLVRIAYEHKWISEKQNERWQDLLVNIKFKTLNWIKSDATRA